MGLQFIAGSDTPVIQTAGSGMKPDGNSGAGKFKSEINNLNNLER